MPGERDCTIALLLIVRNQGESPRLSLWRFRPMATPPFGSHWEGYIVSSPSHVRDNFSTELELHKIQFSRGLVCHLTNGRSPAKGSAAVERGKAVKPFVGCSGGSYPPHENSIGWQSLLRWHRVIPAEATQDAS
jgi:hypothetical protein